MTEDIGNALANLKTWTPRSNLPRLFALTVFANDELLGLGEEARVSRDGGRTWTTLDLPGRGRSASGKHASTSEGTFVSEDGWRSWTKVHASGLSHLLSTPQGIWGTLGGKIFQCVDEEWKCVLDIGRSLFRSLTASADHTTLVAVAGKASVWRSEGQGDWEQHAIKGPKSLMLDSLLPLDAGFAGITAHPHTLWCSDDGADWFKVSKLPYHWCAMSRGDSLLLTGGQESDWFVQGGRAGVRIEPYEATPIVLLASGPDEFGDRGYWGLAQLDSSHYSLLYRR